MSDGVRTNGGALLYETPQRGVTFEEGELYLLEALKKAPLKGWKIYAHPYMNGQRPDFVLTHPERGILIIEVKDYDLESYRRHNGQCQVRSGSDWRDILNPVKQVESYKDNLLKLYSRQYETFSQTFSDSYAVVETVLYFHRAPRDRARAFCGNPTYTCIADRQMVDELAAGNFDSWTRENNSKVRPVFGSSLSKFAKPTPMTTMNAAWEKQTTEENLLKLLVDDLHPWLTATDSALLQMQPIALTPDEQRRAAPKIGNHRLRGVAGSGKTIILAEQAAQLLMQGKTVLILTFNITLIHYLLDRVLAQLEAEERKEKSGAVRQNLSVYHFHGFLKMLAAEYDVELPPCKNDYILQVEWPRIIRELRQEIRESGKSPSPLHIYDAILIDEAQDFHQEWINTALDWQNEDSENHLFVTYDVDQDIYKRDAESWLDKGEGQAATIKREKSGWLNRGSQLHFPVGAIPTIMQTKRLPEAVTEVVSIFRNRYIDSKSRLESGRVKSNKYRCSLLWENVEWTTEEDCKKYIDRSVQEFKRKQAHPNDTVFLTISQDMGVLITNHLISRGFLATHVFDLSGGKDYEVRRKEKWRFQPNAGSIKICTVHSIKGWEAPYVQLVIHKEATLEEAKLIYVALTRLKQLERGGEGVLRVLNYSRVFDEMAEVFKKIERSQPPLGLFER